MSFRNRFPPLWHISFMGVLLLAMTVGAVGLFVFGALAPFITADLGISRFQFGTLPTFYFIAAMILSNGAGRLVHKRGGRPVLLTLFAISGVGAIAVSAAPSYPWLIGAAVIMGMGLAISNPVTNQLVSVHLDVGQQGLAIGIKQSGTYLGALLAGAALPAIAVRWGWRVGFGSVSLAAVLGFAIAFVVVPKGPSRSSRTWTSNGQSESEGDSDRFRPLVRYAFFMAAGSAAVPAYLALYAHETLELSETSAGHVLALLGVIGVVARVAWGPIAERLPTTSGPLVVIGTAGVFSQLAVAWAEPGKLLFLWIGVAGLGMGALGFTAIAMTGVVRDATEDDTGRISGRVLTGFFGGMVVGPPVFGGLVDMTGSYMAGWGFNVIMFAIALGVASSWRRIESAAASQTR